MGVPSSRRRLQGFAPAALAAIAGVLAVAALPVCAASFRWSPGQPEDESNPIAVYADRISSWKEGDELFLLVSGKVWVNQGLINLRFGQGVIRVRDARRSDGRYHLLIYAEGDVAAESGAKKHRGADALLQLTTRRAVKFKPANNRISAEIRKTEPLIRRAFGEFTKAPPAGLAPQLETRPSEAAFKSKNPIQLTGGVQPPLEQPKGKGQPEVVPLPPPKGPPQLPKGGLGLFPNGLPPGVERQYFIRPRSALMGFHFRSFALPTGETAVVVSSGIILTVTNVDGHGGILDVEADRLVFWTRGNPQQILQNMQGNRDQSKRPMEFYLSGHVEIRTKAGQEDLLLRADEVYYDVNRHAAIATLADLQINDPRLINPLHVQADELVRVNEKMFQARAASLNASALPRDPGLSLHVQDATLEMRPFIPRTTVFGLPIVDSKTGQQVVEEQRYFTGRQVVARNRWFPFFYLPYVQGDADDPLGPLENIGVNYNSVFGAQIYTTWDIYNLLGLSKTPNSTWRLNADYLSERGPALGSDFTRSGTELFGIPNRYSILVKAYGIQDSGVDRLGGGRGRRIFVAPMTSVPVTHPDWRGRFFYRLNLQDLPNGFSVQSQGSAQSDKNFMEQYFRQEFRNELDQTTYLYGKQQLGNAAWTGLVQPRVRRWMTKTEWLPRFDGYLLGLSFFDLVSYNARASAGYGQLRTTDEPPPAYRATDVDTNTGRFDLWQEASVPFYAGPVKLAPYGIVDTAWYSNDLTGSERGRFYGAGGVRASIPFSRLYPDVESELFNLNGIFHKIVVSGNFYTAHTDTSYRQLAKLDRFNDDVSDQALRDIFPRQSVLNPANAVALTTSPLFDPQEYAVRRLILNRIDTLDDIQVLRMNVRQRWQTKRGYPGRQHIVDWMTLELSSSFFPHADRDNFGEPVAFLQYDWRWNIGDRTSVISSGWVDPIPSGARVFDVGCNFNRPDATLVYLGYRHIDPLQSRSVIGAITYQFSPKYSMTVRGNWDFGIKQQNTTFYVTRTGTDVRLSLGVSYNSILDTFGVIFEVVPNLFPSQLRSPGSPQGILASRGPGR